MKYEKSEETIYTTTDYDGFIFTDWNRAINNSRVVKMVESIKRFGWLPEPVLVNEKWEVIDGQSRVKALEQLGLPVEFIIKEGIGREECQALNLFQKNWSIVDYINSYASDGNSHYIWLRELLKKYRELRQGIVLAVACYRGSRSAGAGHYGDMICGGTFKTSESERRYIDGACFYLTRFIGPIKYIGGRRDRYYAAIIFLYGLDGVDRERLCRVVNTAQYELRDCSTIEGWLKQFENLYNKNQRKDNKLYFEHAYMAA